MQNKPTHPDQYIEQLTDDRKEVFEQLRKTILENLPTGFEETMSYGMIGFVVPHTIYSKGYHCDPKLPLPFISIASQKNAIALHHMGMYAEPKLLEWFCTEYPKHSTTKLDMGKSCVRFKKINELPFKLIGELSAKMTADEWIKHYETTFKK